MAGKTAGAALHPTQPLEYGVESGVSFFGAHLDPLQRRIHSHCTFTGHTIILLKDEKRAFLHAAGQAQIAVDWLLAKSPAPSSSDMGQEAADVAA